MATFGEFTVARLGMIASQMALNVTGQNISNINTPGYTRQQLDQYSFITNSSGLYHSSSSASVGSGVMLAGVSQLRDPYLDIRFRKEMSSVGSTDATLNVLDQVQSVINNVNKEGIVTQLQDLFSRISELGSHVGEQEFETLMRESAQDICTLLNASASKLQQVYDNILQQYNENVQDANNVLTKIQELNEQIRIADINGDSALELRDQRNTLIDTLSEYMKIDVTYGKEDVGAGVEVEKLTIKLVDNTTGKPGQMLIDGINRADISLVDGDPDMFLNISELHDPDGIQTSNTSSRFTLSGLYFDKALAANYQETITVNYTDAAGNKNSVDLMFNVIAPTDPNDQNAVEAARAATIQNLQTALEQNATLKDRFTVIPTNTGVSLVSQQQGADALNITSMELPAGSQISFTSQKATAAVLSNEGAITDGMGYGALESTRQMLVGSGEFSTDAAYRSIRGIPYYMRSLDMLANKFATEMNRVNTTNANGESLADLGVEGAGNLFVADGDDPDNPTKLITASNISLSDKWQTGETTIVPSTKPDAVSSENDNINRFQNILNEAHNYQATDIVRQDDTPFTSGKLEQTGAAGQNLQAQITYIDSMNQKHTVTVNFASGADADATLANLQTAIGGNPNLTQFATVTVNDGAITMTANDGDIENGVLCSLVTDIQITDDQGAATDAFKMGAGRIGGAVASSNIYQGNLESCYSNMEGVLGSHINTTSTIYETYATAADEINTSRDSVSGVDLNDEGINLLQYQKSFAAACRLMTALDEAMDKVINGMGIVGR
ncbi:FlgK family flagellar hook-associated protein [Candidatus Agathobaculum pullicola]|uniref:FlgK family flagellar hook-associated protein n=1 Tax=Candidatus Agathobaculum pullicola TaxID=2838426 RepID=UPI003F92394E